jgi:hypothetical protein
MSKPRAFWYHYNKPASAKAGRPMFTVHQSGVCHVVHGVQCHVPTRTRIRSSQPRAVVGGVGRLRIEDGLATVS